ncbi:hypothetical protein [Chitinilyticum piscinae]|uniref:MalT-like TPR region domain-containing protein n=1 Tax=Chitinilyticum piscinae TaxID=2866724 RepID=A0A8J7FPD4_9NEIS|nr:hypothetical protein [Chitinilyticum piscinae]MBE9608106.1 hypothetical protein [Chitinilyticum piscinae]
MLDLRTVSADDLPAACQLLEDLFLQDINIALASSQQLMARCRELDSIKRARPWLLHVKMLWGAGHYMQALQASTQLATIIRNEQAHDQLAEHHLLRGLIQMSLKHNGTAAEEYATAIELALNQGQISIAIEAFISISQSYGMLGLNNEARSMLEVANRLAFSINDHKQIGKSAIFLAGNLIQRGEHRHALRLLRQAEPSLLRHGDMTWLVEAGNYMGVCHQREGEMELAGVYFESMFALARAMNALWSRALTSINFAGYLLESGDPDHARQVLVDSQDAASHFDMGFLQRESLQLLVRACRQQGAYDAALDYLRQYENLMLTLMQQGLNEANGNNPLLQPRLEPLRRKITAMVEEFEYMAGLFAPAEIGMRGLQLRMRCLRADDASRLLLLRLGDEGRQPDLVDQRLHGILRQLLGESGLWLHLRNSEYLLLPDTQDSASRERLEQELAKALQHYPWRWHGLAQPTYSLHALTRQQALEKLPASGDKARDLGADPVRILLDRIEADRINDRFPPEDVNLPHLVRELASQQHPEVGRARMLHGIALLNGLFSREACRALAQARRELEHVGDPEYQALAGMMLSAALSNCGQLYQAVQTAIETIELAVDLGRYDLAIECFLHIGQILRLQGEFGDNRTMLETGLDLARWCNNDKLVAKAAILLADQLLLDGAPDEARQVLESAQPAISRHGDTTWLVEYYSYLARCLESTLTAPSRVDELYRAALALASSKQLLWGLVAVTRYYANYQLEHGRAGEALAMLQSAEPTCRQFGLSLRSEYCESFFRVYRALGDWPMALQWLKHYEETMLAHLSNDQPEHRKMGPRQLKSTNSRLQRLRMQLEKHVGWLEPAAQRRQLRTLQLALQHAGSATLLELECQPSPENHIGDLICRLIDHHCSARDIWVGHATGRYHILPSRQDALLDEFASSLLDKLQQYAWRRHGHTDYHFTLHRQSSSAHLAHELIQELQP